ncbi:hypothetical protein ABK040_011895 [Willaertia magna]
MSIRLLLSFNDKNLPLKLNKSPLPSFDEFYESIKTKLKNNITSDATITLEYFDESLSCNISLEDDDGLQDLIDYCEQQNLSSIKITITSNTSVNSNSISNSSNSTNSRGSNNSSTNSQSNSNNNNKSFKSLSGNSGSSSFGNSNNNGMNSGLSLMELLEEKYSDIVFLDKGGFGSVYRATSYQTNRSVAIKIIEVEEIFGINQALSEAMKTTSLIHPNIVRVNSAFLLSLNKLAIEMELLGEGNLMKFVDPKNNIKLNDKLILQIILQCCSALNYLEERKIIHRDIKPQNILLRKLDQDNVEAVVTDFGLAKSKGNNSFLSFGGTARYLSPEVMNNQDGDELPYSPASDMFAFGVSLYRLITNDMTTDIAQLYDYLTEDNVKDRLFERMKKNELISNKYLEIIWRMIKKDPNERITSSQVIEELSEKKVEEKVQQQQATSSIATNNNNNNNSGYLKGKELYDNYKYSEALECLLKCKTNSGGSDELVTLLIANCYREIYKYSDAISYYEKALQEYKNDKIKLSKVYLELSLYNDAISKKITKREQINKAIELNPNDIQIKCVKSMWLSEIKDFTQSLHLINEAKMKDMNNFWVNRALGSYHKNKSEKEKAELFFKKNLELYPNNYLSHIDLGDFYFTCGKYDLQIEVFNNYLKTHEPDGMILFYLGFGYGLSGNVDKAIECGEQVIDMYPYSFIGPVLVIFSYNCSGDAEAALDYYNNLNIFMKNNELVTFMTASALKNENVDEAIELFEKCYQLNPEYEEVTFQLGEYYYNIKDYNLATNYLLKTLEINPGHESAHNWIGLCYYNEGNYQTAIGYFQKAFDLSNGEGYIYMYNIGLSNKHLGNDQLAFECFDKSSNINPTYIPNYTEGASLFIKHNRIREAINILIEAFKIEPSRELANSIGSHYNSIGEYFKAQEYYNKASYYQ